MKNNKTRFFYVLYSDKTWVFDQSERAQGPIYIINIYRLFAGREACIGKNCALGFDYGPWPQAEGRF